MKSELEEHEAAAQLRDRALLPLAIPLGAFVVVGVLVFCFSRILLAVPRQLAPAVAIAVALDILACCAVLSWKGPTRAAYGLAGALGGVIVVGGLISIPAASRPHREAGEAAPPAGFVAKISAKDIAFDRQTLELPAETAATIEFVNADAGVPHNVAIYSGPDAAQRIFAGEVVTGPKTIRYRIPKTPAAGQYFFRCDVHPTQMTGTVVVKAAAPAPSPEGGLRVVARNVAFDTTEIALRAGEEAVIRFENRDAGVLHNIAIYSGPERATVIFRGPTFAGPATRTYRFPAPPPGTYYFQCDVHPSMSGSVRVT